jgi:hypothetical protein
MSKIKMKNSEPALTKQETIEAIIKEAKKLDKMQLQILLTKLRVKKLLREKRKSVANYNSKRIKPPTMADIDAWKHEARKQYAHK